MLGEEQNIPRRIGNSHRAEQAVSSATEISLGSHRLSSDRHVFPFGPFMTDIPPPTPPDPPPPIDLAYQTPPPFGKAPLLVKVTAILTLVSAGIDVLSVGMCAFLIGVIYFSLLKTPSPPGTPPLLLMMSIVYGTPAVLCLLVVGFKTCGGVKLLRRGPRAWGWGLAAAIIGCAEIWTIYPCCAPALLQIGIGVYSLIVLCNPNVRRYLRLDSADIVPPAPNPATNR
jgi:hypothetical protein